MPTLSAQTLCRTAEVARVYALDFSQLVKVAVRGKDAREIVLEHHSSVDQISGVERGITLGELPGPVNVRECHRQGCGNDRLQLGADLPGLVRETNGQVAVQNLLMDLTADDGLKAFLDDPV